MEQMDAVTTGMQTCARKSSNESVHIVHDNTSRCCENGACLSCTTITTYTLLHRALLQVSAFHSVLSCLKWFLHDRVVRPFNHQRIPRNYSLTGTKTFTMEPELTKLLRDIKPTPVSYNKVHWFFSHVCNGKFPAFWVLCCRITFYWLA